MASKFQIGDVIERNDGKYFCVLLITEVIISSLSDRIKPTGDYHYKRLIYRKIDPRELGDLGRTWDRIGHIDAFYKKSDEWSKLINENMNLVELLYGE